MVVGCSTLSTDGVNLKRSDVGGVRIEFKKKGQRVFSILEQPNTSGT